MFFNKKENILFTENESGQLYLISLNDRLDYIPILAKDPNEVDKILRNIFSSKYVDRGYEISKPTNVLTINSIPSN
jgi:hypothetical protein